MENNYLRTYNNIGKITSTPRETEARILIQGAAKLHRCVEEWDVNGSKRPLYDALIYNRKIWTLFQSELSKESSPQPTGIRKNLLSLSIYINKQIRAAMEEPSREKLNSILDINMIIAKGLEM